MNNPTLPHTSGFIQAVTGSYRLLGHTTNDVQTDEEWGREHGVHPCLGDSGQVYRDTKQGTRIYYYGWTEARQDLEHLDKVVEMSNAMECDRTLLADALTNIDKQMHSRFWLTEGRGCYEWDDDKYRGEFHDACVALQAAIEPLRRIARDWTHCPPTSSEVALARQRIDGPVGNADESAANALRWLDRTPGNPGDYPDLPSLDEEYKATCRLLTERKVPEPSFSLEERVAQIRCRERQLLDVKSRQEKYAETMKRLADDLQGMVDNITEHASPRNERLCPIKGSRMANAIATLAAYREMGLEQ